jgi:diguanylate cyclase (GGDEF)-like protein
MATNDKGFNSALLLAILLTVIALTAQQYFPERRLLLTPSAHAKYSVYSIKLDNGEPAGSWLDEAKLSLRCVYPEHYSNSTYFCGFDQILAPSGVKGLNLSVYDHLNLRVKYSGNAKKIRFFIRNYNPAYSKPDDQNSAKFNAVSIDAEDLKSELKIGLNEFAVSDWWVSDFNVPRKLSHPEITNVLLIGVDFPSPVEPGNHDLTIEKIEFVGPWISAEHWYLAVLSCWMLGVFFFAARRLIKLNQQTHHDVEVINALNRDRQNLISESDKLKHLSTIDPLTEAYNRFGIDQIIQALITGKGGRNRTRSGFALMVLDIDLFKRVNDSRGHDAGDRVLQAIAKIIRMNIREQDFIGRWGGEEFVVILPGTRKELAMDRAEKIRLAIFGWKFEPDQPLNISVSIGVGEALPGEDFATTFKRTDMALFQAKSLGRNRCIMAKESLNAE